MGLGAVSGAQATSGASSSSGQSGNALTGPGGSVNENTFLQLLVAQMQYQDPLQPTSSTQFVTQLAQFQTLSVLTNIQSDLQQLVAAAGAGKTGSTAATGQSSTGGASSKAAGA